MYAFDSLAKLGEEVARSLTPLQRILLSTDGTLTEILEAFFLERIQLIKLHQQISPVFPAHKMLGPAPGEQFLERKILLRGAKSSTTYVYAESVIAHERLTPSFRDALLASDIPLGRLWLEHRLETFKELIDVRRQPAHDLAHHFGCEARSPLLMRTYCVINNAKPMMIISEYFSGE